MRNDIWAKKSKVCVGSKKLDSEDVDSEISNEAGKLSGLELSTVGMESLCLDLIVLCISITTFSAAVMPA